MKTPKDLKPKWDFDFLLHRAGYSADSQYRKQLRELHPGISDEDLEKRFQEEDFLSHALHNIKVMVEGTLEMFNGEECTSYLYDSGNYRYNIATIRPYKGNRVNIVRPKYMDEMKKYMVDVYDARLVRGMESDDAIAIDHYADTDKYSVIIAQDKDLIQGVPGWVFNPIKDELKYNSLADANMFHFYQMLVGDTADNIPGIRGIGDKKASALIAGNDNNIDRVRTIVQELYKKEYGDMWQPCYEEVSRLLWILRKPEQLDTGCPFLYA